MYACHHVPVPMLSSSMRSMKNSPLSCGENGGTPGLVVDTTAVEPLPVKAEVSTASSGSVPLFPVNVTAHVRPFWLFTEAVTEACSNEGEGETWEGSARRWYAVIATDEPSVVVLTEWTLLRPAKASATVEPVAVTSIAGVV